MSLGTGIEEGELFGGRYVTVERIGAGGMGEVWRGTDIQLGRPVAIKVLLPAMLDRPDSIARFEREARVGAALSHPHVVHTLDYGEHEGRWYLVMQLATGGSLLDYRGDHAPVSPAAIIDFGYQIADGLAAAHAIGMVHRDLKPENVLLDRVGDRVQARIADLGMAYAMASADPKTGKLTLDGGFGGTPDYMAPEIIQGDGAGPASDIYALGCVLFELATDAPPFEQPSVAKLFAAHLYAAPPKVRDARPDLPPGFEELVQRMLSKHPAERPTADAAKQRIAVLDPEKRYGDFVPTREPQPPEGPSFVKRMADGGGTQLLGGRRLVELHGALDRDCMIALAAAGFDAVAVAAKPVARLIVGASLDELARACTGIPVIADAARDDFPRISALLRLGVAEVVFTPIGPDKLVEKLQRAIRKRPEVSPR